MLTDIVGWWTHYGEMLLNRWKEGRYTWHSHFPFLAEVVDYDRIKRPWMYDNMTGDYLNPHPEHRWIDPKEMLNLRQKLYQ